MSLKDFKNFNECIYENIREEVVEFIHNRYRWKNSNLSKNIIKIEIKELIYSLLKDKYNVPPKIYKNIEIQISISDVNSYGYHGIDFSIYYR